MADIQHLARSNQKPNGRHTTFGPLGLEAVGTPIPGFSALINADD
jgi:hypothetical protein